MSDLPAGFRVVAPPKKPTSIPDGFSVVTQPEQQQPAASTNTPIGFDPMALDPAVEAQQQAKDAAPAQWERGVLAPVERNSKSGELRWAIPSFLEGLFNAGVDAATLPGDAMQGKVPGLDPRTGFKDITPETLGRIVNFSTLAPLAATGAPVQRAAMQEAERLAAKQAQDMGIPLSTGQKTGDIRQLTKEEILRQTDTPAQPIMRRFDETQRAAIEQANGNIGQSFGPAGDMAGSVQQGLRDKVAFSKQRAESLYKIAEDGNLVIQPQAVADMPKFVESRLQDNPIIMDPTLTPNAVMGLKMLQDAGANAGALNTELKGIELMRKRLNTLSPVTPSDKAATRSVKGAFDDWLQNTIDQALYSGDETAVNALKAARAESKVYLGITSPKTGDVAGKTMAKMVSQDITAEQAANWLFGADIVSPNLNAPLVAAKIKTTLGPFSPEWASVRAAAWKRLTTDLGADEVKSATMLSKRIDNFLGDKGSSLSKVLFSEEERNRMKAFAAVLKRTITPADARNPSRSAFMLSKIMGPALSAVVGAAGFASGGWGGLAAAAAVPIFRNIQKVRFASKSVAGKIPRPVPTPAKVALTDLLRAGGSQVADPSQDLASMATQIAN
jgi:hypothetical protein